MRSLALLLLFCGDLATESSVGLGLKFLARHQNEDGSWSRPSDACRCPFGFPVEAPIGIPPDPKVKESVDRLVARLDDDDIRVRAQAQKELLRLGAPAAPFLWKLSGEGDPEPRARCRDTLKQLWSSDLETRVRWSGKSVKPEGAAAIRSTSFALLNFFGAGYSQLSRDEFADPAFPQRQLKMGETVKKGLIWLLQQQNAEGAFAPDDPLAHTMATLALSEAYGMTASAPLKDPAEKSIAVLRTLTSADPCFNTWKGIALYSARTSEIPFPKEELNRQVELLSKEESTPALAGAVLLSSLDTNTVEQGLLVRFAKLDPDALTSDELWLATAAARAVWDPDRWEWKQWSEKIKPRCVSSQNNDRGCGYGGWTCSPGGFEVNLLATCTSINTLVRYYRYAYPFAQRPERHLIGR